MGKRMYKKIITTIFSLFIICLLVTVVACNFTPNKNSKIIDTLELDSYKGKWLLINYWATWCKPCYDEIPELNQFYLKHKQQGVIVLGVNFDHISQKKLLQFSKKQKIEYPLILHDPQKQLHLDNIPTIPVTFIVSPEGKVTKYLQGPQTVSSLEENLGLRQAH